MGNKAVKAAEPLASAVAAAPVTLGSQLAARGYTYTMGARELGQGGGVALRKGDVPNTLQQARTVLSITPLVERLKIVVKRKQQDGASRELDIPADGRLRVHTFYHSNPSSYDVRETKPSKPQNCNLNGGHCMYHFTGNVVNAESFQMKVEV
jgi:hypothetical protein